MLTELELFLDSQAERIQGLEQEDVTRLAEVLVNSLLDPPTTYVRDGLIKMRGLIDRSIDRSIMFRAMAVDCSVLLLSNSIVTGALGSQP